MARFTGVLGLLTMLLLAWLFSSNRRAIRWRTVFWGLSLQIVFAVLVLKWTFGQHVLATVGAAITRMLAYSYKGSEMVFGELGKQHSSVGLIFATQVAPTIIFISALFAILYHIGVMQIVISFFARLMQWTMKVSRRGKPERCGQHLHGPDRSAADHPPVSARSHALRADDHHDERHGPRFRRHHGGLHTVRN